MNKRTSNPFGVVTRMYMQQPYANIEAPENPYMPNVVSGFIPTYLGISIWLMYGKLNSNDFVIVYLEDCTNVAAVFIFLELENQEYRK